MKIITLNNNMSNNDSSNYTLSIIGFLFFGISELLPILPIPANGFIHSLFIGLRNSFTQKPNIDLEIAHSLVNTRPVLANLVNTLEGNDKLIDVLKLITLKPNLIPLIEKIANDPNLEVINNVLINNPDDMKVQTKRIIFSKLSENNNDVLLSDLH
jgi:hypothetical protein